MVLDENLPHKDVVQKIGKRHTRFVPSKDHRGINN